jgi:DNA-binding transcriptional LysR family regulator
VTLRQWRAFSAAARDKSFARAAQELHLTPSAISLQIKEVEKRVGMSLLVRTARGVMLTPAGDLLLADVNRALQAFQDAEDKIARLSAPETGMISLGLVSNAQYFLPRVIARFQRSYGGVELRTVVGNGEELIRLMRNGEIDLAIMGRAPRGPDILAEAFATQPLGILASPEHPLSGSRAIPVSSLRGQPFIVRERGSGARAAMERFFRDAQVMPSRLMEMSSNELIKQAVIANMGLGFLSLHTACLELPKKLLVALDVQGLPIVKHWYVARSGRGRRAAAAEALRELLLTEGEHLLGQTFAGVPAPERSHPIDHSVIPELALAP